MGKQIGKIYIIENDINNLKYIGQTVQPIKNRFKQHILAASSTKFTAKLPKAIREIGYEHFSIRLIQECNIDELNSLEVKYIKQYNTYHTGYNSTPGGDNGKSVFMDLDIDKFTEMYNNKVTVVEMATYFKCSVKTIHSIKEIIGLENNRQAFGNRNSKRKPSDKARGIVQYDNYFNAIRHFETMAEAIKFNNGNEYWYYYVREACLRGNIAYGFRWQYKDDLLHVINEKEIAFNTIFDKQAYLENNTLEIHINSVGLYRVNNLIYADIQHIGESAREMCKVCNAKLGKGNVCNKCNQVIKETSKLTEKYNRLEELRQLANSGLSLNEMGRKTGLSGNGIKKILIANNIEYNTKFERNMHIGLYNGMEYTFESHLQAAEWVLNKGLSASTRYAVANRIKSAAKLNNTAFNVQWRLG